MRVLSVFGTRPEAIKMAPVVRAVEAATDIESRVCVTGQHRDLLAPVMDLFGLRADVDLDLMRPDQTLTHITTGVLDGLAGVLTEVQPDWVLVHGDTTTSTAAALAAFYARIPVGHVEAGLRTGNLASPYPEEMNRQVTARLTRANFAPTATARANLLAEGIPDDRILVTGNTVIDALMYVNDVLLAQPGAPDLIRQAVPKLDLDKPLVLVTGHRRENFDGGLDAVCRALVDIARQHDVEIVYAVHPNPHVKEATERLLSGEPGIHLVAPPSYLPFVALMARSRLIISDSGGVQEEAPALGVPVLVTRELTERPEAVEAGVVRLVGTDQQLIVAAASELISDDDAHAAMSQVTSPYGDGHASARILDHLRAVSAPGG